MEKQDMRVLTLDPYQHGVVINALNNLRNDLIEDKRPTDILMSLEYNSLPNTQVQALLKSPSPLADVFAAWEDRETSYMEEIWQTVTGRAKEETQKFRNAQKER